MSSPTMSHSVDTAWLVFTLPAVLTTNNMFNGFVLLCILISTLFIWLVSWVLGAGGPAWRNGRNHLGKVPIPGPRGLPFFGSLFSLSHGLAHRTLASMANAGYGAATQLMAFSLGSTPVVVASEPQTAREILTSPHFADRPLKQSAKSLMFGRAIGFAPNGTYWRLLRRISSAHLFSPRRIASHEPGRQLDCAVMLDAIAKEQSIHGVVLLRKHLQAASLNTIMGTVFGKRYDFSRFDNEVEELREIINEGFELLGAFNWSDHLPWLKYFCDPHNINNRCTALVPRVAKFVKSIINAHQLKWLSSSKSNLPDISDFVDVLLSLDGEEKLSIDDMVAVLWEMIFRGTDTTALLTEWAMAELVLNPSVQTKLRRELNSVVGAEPITDAGVAKLPYLEAVVKETLRLHPPGPLLSWARLSTSDVQLSNGMVVPANTTAMVNMWAITHDPNLWDDPLAFRPDRFLASLGGIDIDVRGIDLRLAPFGAGRRSCPGKNLGLTTVSLWVAKLVHHFEWVQDEERPIDLTEELKLSSEMKTPLAARAVLIKSSA